ncbi:MAG: hypothetical protein ROO71_05590 [Balneola sp.]
MKKILLLALFFLPFHGCVETMPTGAEDVQEYQNVKFVVTSKELVDDTFFVEGTVQNQGTETFTPTWFMEAQFYTDSQHSLKLGGAVDSFNFSLENGETTQWSLRYKNSDQDLDDYPDFGISNFRAYKR